MFLSLKKRKGLALPLLLLSIIILVISIVVFKNYLTIDKKAAECKTWPSTTGKVIKSERVLVQKGSFADIEYKYSINNQEFISKRLFYGIKDNGDILVGDKRWHTAWLLDEFPIEKEITVYYNPDDPNEAVLIPNAKTNHQVLLIFGIAFGLFGIFGIIAGIVKK